MSGGIFKILILRVLSVNIIFPLRVLTLADTKAPTAPVLNTPLFYIIPPPFPFSEIFRLSAVSKKSMYVHTKLYVLKKCYARKILIEKLSGFSATQKYWNFRVIQYIKMEIC